MYSCRFKKKNTKPNQKKKPQTHSPVILTFLISQVEDSAGAVSTLHNEAVSDIAYAAATQH